MLTILSKEDIEKIRRAAGHPDAVPPQYIEQFVNGATWALEHRQQFSLQGQKGLRWVKAKHGEVPLEKTLPIKDRKGMYRLGNFFQDGNPNFTWLHIQETSAYDGFDISSVNFEIYEWLDESSPEPAQTEAFPDTEADGYVFCGKCGKKK